MSKVYLEDSTLTSIANAIRDKLNVDTTYLPSEMSNAIENIEGGEITDPHEYYKANRPVNWPKIPLPSEMRDSTSQYYESGECFYFLYEKQLIDDVFTCGMYFNQLQDLEATVLKYNNTQLVSTEQLTVETVNTYHIIDYRDNQAQTYNYVVLKLNITRKNNVYPWFYLNDSPTTISNKLVPDGKDFVEISFKFNDSINWTNSSTSQFSGCTKLQFISLYGGVGNAPFFNGCLNLKGVIEFYAPNTMICKYLFSSCYDLEMLPTLDLRNAPNFSQAFYSCYKLKEVNIKTNNATDFSSMFSGAYSLKSVKGIDTSKATTLKQMFQSCLSLEMTPTLDLTNNPNCTSMFANCYALKTCSLDISSVSTLETMFSECQSLVNLSNASFTNCGTAIQMFYKCYNLESINIQLGSSTTDSSIMFYNCRNLRKAQITLASDQVVSQLFSGCRQIEEVVLNNFYASATSKTSYLFGQYNSTNLKKIRFNFPNTVTSDNLPVISSDAFTCCPHFNGTIDALYNPQGLKDGEIWVESAAIAQALRQATNWSTYADIIYSDEENGS